MNTNASPRSAIEHQLHADVSSKRQRVKLIIIDRERRVLLDSVDPTEHELRLFLSDDRSRLRIDIDMIVESLVEHCERTGERHSRIAVVDSQRYVRVTRLHGRDGPAFALTIESFRGADSLSRATRKYQLTPREIEVLALILEGASAAETAQTLKIAETTVQGYYKRLLSKTNSRNRPAMVANVLDWGGSGRRRTATGEM